LEEYFPTPALQFTVLKPFEVTKTSNTFDVKVKATGGGASGQAGAVRLAIARALLEHDGAMRSVLKEEGLLTRDPRMRERKKSGQPGARKRFQFSKR
jgi:small subunit ribosomal protein S9